MTYIQKTFTLFALLLFLTACGGRTGKSDTRETAPMQPCPTFNSANAMQYIRKQCSFGPRVPGSEAWRACGDSIVAWFSALGLPTEEQRLNVTAYDGTSLPCRNITARLNPESPTRILLCAHWDSRPWADNDDDEQHHHTPVLAANDGASGVAMMLEMARLIVPDTAFTTGIDFVCFDVEDYGQPQWDESEYESEDNGWCLGSKAWATRAAEEGYKARFGILFDMVGGRGSTFAKERISAYYAGPVVEKLWHTAQQLGYGHFFPQTDGGSIVDDHLNVNQIAQIPCIDIVPYHKSGSSSFGPTWHTINDTPENIDPDVLEAVGQSVLQLIYNYNGIQ